MSRQDLFKDRMAAVFAWLHAAVFAAMIADRATSPNPEIAYWKIWGQAVVSVLLFVFCAWGGWYFWSGKFNRHSDRLFVKLFGAARKARS